MKAVILSADNAPSVYLVPDLVASNLEHYCTDFDHWLHHSPQAAGYRRGKVVCYNEMDFVAYLNRRFPQTPSVLVERLDLSLEEIPQRLPQRWQGAPWFNF